MKRVACAIALTGTTLLAGSSLLPVSAAPVTTKGLTLTIPRTGISTNESTTMVEMQFRGGNIRALEMYLDGNLLKKQELETSGGHGTVTLALDGLGDGVHSVLIKALDPEGNWVTTSTKFKVEPQVEVNALAKALFPLRGQMVQGNVPIKLEVSDAIRNPYVSISMDDEWVALMNSAPFTYTWDSTKATNGFHTITADIFDDVAKIKTLKIQINVNNQGGFTTIQHEAPKPVAKPLSSAVAEVASRFSSPTESVRLNDGIGSLVRTAQDVSRDLTMRTGSSPSRSTHFTKGIGKRDRNVLRNDGTRTLTNAAPSSLALLSNPVQIASLSNYDGKIARQNVALANIGNIAIRPGARTLPTNPARRVLSKLTAENIAYRGAYSIYMDSALVKFDVAPRVENGIALAPFRHLYEFSGGQVGWENLTKTVLATKQDQTIKFTIGQTEALINNKVTPLENAPYIDSGRAIVPVSFVSELLNVKVTFDKATGRMLLESRKFANH